MEVGSIVSFFNLGNKPSGANNQKAFDDSLIELISKDGNGTYSKDLLNSLLYAVVRVLVSDLTTNRIEASDKKIEKLINEKPNEDLNGFDFKTSMFSNLLIFGNSYALIDRDNKGNPIALYPLNSRNVSVVQAHSDAISNELVYKYALTGNRTRVIKSKDMIHFKMLSTDGGMTGNSPINSLSNLLELFDTNINSVQRYLQDNGFTNVLTLKNDKVSDETRQQLKNKFMANNANSSTIILDNGFSFDSVDRSSGIISESLKVQELIIRRISAVFGISVQKLGIENVHSSESQSNQNYVQSTLQYYFDLITNELSFKLDADVKFNTDKILGLDEQSKSALVTEQYNSGLLTLNEARERLGLQPIDENEITKNETEKGN
ncbi:phage portal protein [Pediococcus pentosaceus]|nr:phage portal protein [Pediococcus pentosaceus]